MLLIVRCLVLTSLVLSVLGCDSGSSKTGSPVSGSVTLDGTPLDHGTISFSSIDDAKRESSVATITDGKYQIPADNGLVPGKYRVSVSAPSGGVTSTDPNEAMAQAAKPTVERVAPRYNSQTELQVAIESGESTHDFEVKSK